MADTIILLRAFRSVMVLLSVFAWTINSCEVGRYGPNCEHQCHCLVNVLCKEGKCSGMCERGYAGEPYCNQSCPTRKFGLGCLYDCHCINDEICDKVNGDCPSRQCDYQYDGAGCQRKLPRIPRSPSILHVSCRNVTLGWEAFDPHTDDGVGPIGQYLVKAKAENAESWYNPVNVTDQQDQRSYYTAFVTTGLLPDVNYLFRIDVRASQNGKLRGNVQAGLQTSPVLHKCGVVALCEPLIFGDKCQYHCHCHGNADCNQVTGICPNDECDKEYEGPSCQRRLPKLRYPPKLLFQSCNNLTITWDSFIQWVDIGYGPIFQYNLHYKEHDEEDSGSWLNLVNTSHTGQRNFIYSVTSGLKPDYEYLFRVDIVGNNTHPLRTVPGQVNRFVNKCTRCPRNRYGLDCNDECHCKGNKDCDKITGRCTNGHCHPEWTGPSCERRLPILIKPPVLVASACKNITLSWKAFNHSMDIGDGPVGGYRVMSQAVVENASLSWVEVYYIENDGRPVYTVSITREMLVNYEYLFRVDVVALHNKTSILGTTPGISTCPILNRCLSKPAWKEISSVGMRFIFIVAHEYAPNQALVYAYSRDNATVVITFSTTRVTMNMQKSTNVTVTPYSINMFDMADLSDYVKKGVSWSDLFFEMSGNAQFGVTLILERSGLHLAAMALLPVAYWGETYICFGLKRSQNVYILNERAGNEIIVACSHSKNGINITIPYNTIRSVYVDVCRATNTNKAMGVSLSGKYPFGVITVDFLDDVADFCAESESFVGQDMALPMKSFGKEFMTIHTGSMPTHTAVVVQAQHAYTNVTIYWNIDLSYQHFTIRDHLGIITIGLPGYARDRGARRIRSTLPVQVIFVIRPMCPWTSGAEDVSHTILMPDDLFYNRYLIGDVHWTDVFGKPGWYIGERKLTDDSNSIKSGYLFGAYVYGSGTKKAYLHSAGFKSCRYVSPDLLPRECDVPPNTEDSKLDLKKARSTSGQSKISLDWVVWVVWIVSSTIALMLK